MKPTYPAFPYFSVSDLRPAVLTQFIKERWLLIAMLRFSGRSFPLLLVMLILFSTLLSFAIPRFAYLLVTRMSNGGDNSPVYWAIGFFTASLFLLQAIEILRFNLGRIAAKKIDGQVRKQVRDIVLSADSLSQLEQKDYKEQLEKASDQGLTWRVRSAGTAAVGQLELIARLLSAGAMGLALAQFFPLLALMLFLLTLASRSIASKQWMFLENFKDSRMAEKRKVDYWANLASSPEPAKEIRIFGLANWVTQRRLQAHYAWQEDYWRVRRQVLSSQYFPAGIALANAVCALALPGLAALHHQLSMAELSACLVAAWGIFRMAYIGSEAFDIEYGRTAIQALNTLEQNTVVSGKPFACQKPSVAFNDVSFKYPGSPAPVINRLNLSIKPGERIAIVGTNGAGKTTLIKILTGLYQPDQGTISVNGEDLKSINSADWRKNIAVLFQDFVRYPLSVRDNIQAAAPDADTTDDELMALLEQSGAMSVVQKMKQGLETDLWRTGSTGKDLSGGEWQKIALARVLFAATHGKKIIVLDEPTASMDVKAETEFYDRVNALAGDCAVIIISHRLSTIRSADRILLLQNGTFTEQGSHQQLMQMEGQYAQMFNSQASRFQNSPAQERSEDER